MYINIMRNIIYHLPTKIKRIEIETTELKHHKSSNLVELWLLIDCYSRNYFDLGKKKIIMKM